MTEDQKERRNAYRREWAKRHPDRIREYRRTQLRRIGLAMILAERGQNVTKEVTE